MHNTFNSFSGIRLLIIKPILTFHFFTRAKLKKDDCLSKNQNLNLLQNKHSMFHKFESFLFYFVSIYCLFIIKASILFGSSAFYSCFSQKNITIPDLVTIINSQEFLVHVISYKIVILILPFQGQIPCT